MGFDLSGVKPKGAKAPAINWSKATDKEMEAYWKWQENTPGAYFRNNVWWWRPLWNYVVENCDDILSVKDANSGSFNDGHLIRESKAIAIGNRLHKLIKSGETQKYAEEYKKRLDALPLVECSICKGTGKRNDKVVKGKCNGCNGTGKTESWDKSYPFSVENVKEFADFCLNSGGFEIC